MDARRAAADTRTAPDGMTGYDADAQFKRPVPKPAGYLPGGTSPTWHTHEIPAPYLAGTRAPRPADPASRADLPGTPHPVQAVDGERGDRLRAWVDRPEFRDPTDSGSPDRYGDPLTRPDGTRIPCFDGPPRREQTRQGWAGDCGIIATLGAVAAHRPEEITRRIRPREDGSYQVTLSETRSSGGVTEPTGRDIELTVTPDLPVYEADQATPACAKVQDGVAWCAIAEKAIAGLDETWTAGRRASWEADWSGLCASDLANDVEKPRSGPAATGYARLHQGSTPWEQAEALTQLTGEPAEVRTFPAGRDEWLINRIIRAQLTDNKPVLVSTRAKTHEHERMPHRLEDEHVYEVTGIEKGKILLRNPWNDRHPEPMETDEFARNMDHYYSTLI